MREANKAYPISDFPVPRGISFVTIDNKTGKRVSPKAPNSVLEAFMEGTEPGGTSFSGQNTTANRSTSKLEAKTQQQNETDTETGSSDFLKEDIQ